MATEMLQNENLMKDPTHKEHEKKEFEYEIFQGKLLTEGTGTSLPADTQLCVMHTKAFPLAEDEVLEVMDTHGKPYADGIHFKAHRTLFGKTSIVLHDKSHEPIAMCQQMLLAPTPAYTIYGRKPLLDGYTGGMVQAEKVRFFPWYQVSEVDLSNRRVLIMKWNGLCFMPFLSATGNDCQHTIEDGRGFGILVGRIEKKNEFLPHDETVRFQWNISVHPEADPAMMLCIAAVLDNFFYRAHIQRKVDHA
jgi:hypothetical protein